MVPPFQPSPIKLRAPYNKACDQCRGNGRNRKCVRDKNGSSSCLECVNKGNPCTFTKPDRRKTRGDVSPIETTRTFCQAWTMDINGQFQPPTPYTQGKTENVADDPCPTTATLPPSPAKPYESPLEHIIRTQEEKDLLNLCFDCGQWDAESRRLFFIPAHNITVKKGLFHYSEFLCYAMLANGSTYSQYVTSDQGMAFATRAEKLGCDAICTPTWNTLQGYWNLCQFYVRKGERFRAKKSFSTCLDLLDELEDCSQFMQDEPITKLEKGHRNQIILDIVAGNIIFSLFYGGSWRIPNPLPLKFPDHGKAPCSSTEERRELLVEMAEMLQTIYKPRPPALNQVRGLINKCERRWTALKDTPSIPDEALLVFHWYRIYLYLPYYGTSNNSLLIQDALPRSEESAQKIITCIDEHKHLGQLPLTTVPCMFAAAFVCLRKVERLVHEPLEQQKAFEMVTKCVQILQGLEETWPFASHCRMAIWNLFVQITSNQSISSQGHSGQAVDPHTHLPHSGSGFKNQSKAYLPSQPLPVSEARPFQGRFSSSGEGSSLGRLGRPYDSVPQSQHMLQPESGAQLYQNPTSSSSGMANGYEDTSIAPHAINQRILLAGYRYPLPNALPEGSLQHPDNGFQLFQYSDFLPVPLEASAQNTIPSPQYTPDTTFLSDGAFGVSGSAPLTLNNTYPFRPFHGPMGHGPPLVHGQQTERGDIRPHTEWRRRG